MPTTNSWYDTASSTKRRPGGVHRDQAGLGAVEREMRIGAAPAGEPAGFRHRRPERRLRVIVLDAAPAARATAMPSPRAPANATACLSGGRTYSLSRLDAAAEPAGRQHDGAPRGDAARLAIDRKHGAGDAAVRAGQFPQRCIEPDRHLALAQAVEQPRRQRVAHQEPRAARGGAGGRWRAATAATARGGNSQPIRTAAPAARCRRGRSSCRRAP